MSIDTDAQTNSDVQWLLDKTIEKDLIGLAPARIKQLIDRIATFKREQLPHTVGLFGGWGSGKTTFLGLLARECLQKKLPTLYFNAWRHAGDNQLVPALIYRLIQSVPVEPNSKGRERVWSVLLAISNVYGNQLNDWVKHYSGIDPAALYKGMQVVNDAAHTPERAREKLLDEYFCRNDRIQKTLQEVLSTTPKYLVVLVDELDRCDPGEALEVMKQIRTLLSSRGIPIVFVLAANPEPIGLAIKHKYGLNTRGTDYEARRILEKYVDTYIDLSSAQSLESYVQALWASSKLKLKESSFIVALDARTRRSEGRLLEDDTVAYAKAAESMSLSHPLLGNLRLLEKSIQAIGPDEEHPWTVWHLEILNQADPDLRKNVKRIAGKLTTLTERACRAVIRALSHEGQIQNEQFLKELQLSKNPCSTPFAVFRRAFWEETNSLLQELSSGDVQAFKVLEQLRDDVDAMEFIISTCLINLGQDIDALRVNSPDAGKLNDCLRGGETDRVLGAFGWLLANY